MHRVGRVSLTHTEGTEGILSSQSSQGTESESSKLRSARIASGTVRSELTPSFDQRRVHPHDAPFPGAGKEHGVLALAWSATGAAKVAAFVPALIAQSGGQALFVACTAAFATQYGDDPRRLLALAFAGVLVKVAGQTGAATIQAGVVARVGRRLRAALLADDGVGHSLHGPRLADHASGPRASLAARVPAELAARVEDVERGIDQGLMPTLRATAELIPLLALVLWTVPRFALLSLAVVLPFGLWLSRSRRRLSTGVEQQLAARARLHDAFDQAVRHDDLWRVHGASDRIRGSIDRAGEEQGVLGAKLAARAELASGQNEALGVVFVWLCVALAPDLATAPALLLRFLAAFFLTYKPLRQLVTARVALARGRAALRTLAWVPGPSPSLEAGPARAARPWPPGELRLSGAVLPFGSRVPVELRAAPGSLWLITGPSGSGKSTLLRTLLGLVPLEGQCEYAGRSLSGAGVGPDQRPFAWMPQSCPVVGASVEEALLLGAEAVGLQLLDGVRGDAHTLSGGEAQRVAFVRALSTPMPVVLLDEPTAHLDGALSERLVELVQRERERGRSFVIVTHEPERFRRLPAPHEISMQSAPVYAQGEAAE